MRPHSFTVSVIKAAHALGTLLVTSTLLHCALAVIALTWESRGFTAFLVSTAGDRLAGSFLLIGLSDTDKASLSEAGGVGQTGVPIVTLGLGGGSRTFRHWLSHRLSGL